jgi:hypothetical protein
MEDVESQSRLSGEVHVSQRKVLVLAEELGSGTKLRLFAKAYSVRTLVRLSLNRLSFDFVVDEKVQSLVNDLRKLIARGSAEAEIVPVARGIISALQINTGYRAFVEQVKSSGAFDALVAIDHLITAASIAEELEGNVALLILRSTARLFAPLPMRNAPYSQSARDNGSFVKASHMRNVAYPSVNSTRGSNPLQNPLCMVIFMECLKINNCGGFGQPIDAICFLLCAALAVGCDIII